MHNARTIRPSFVLGANTGTKNLDRMRTETSECGARLRTPHTRNPCLRPRLSTSASLPRLSCDLLSV